jgi:hypothetical protein
MPRFALPSLLAATLLLPVAAPATAADAAAGPVGASVQVVTSGLAFGDFTFPLAAGKKVSIQRHVLDPGEIVRWNKAGTTVAINQTGQLQNFPSCKTQQLWRAFPAYYTVRSKELGTLAGVTANLGDKQVTLFTITSDAVGAPQTDAQLHRHSGDEVPGVGDLTGGGEDEQVGPGDVVDPIAPAAGCPGGAPAESTTLASGVMGTSQGIDLVDHNQIAIYRHTLPAGYNSGWYAPFDPTFIVPVRGELTTQQDCGDATVRRPGEAFVAGTPMLARTTGAAEYLSVSWNIQNGFPVDQPFYVPELPPTDCPDSPLT